jgi:hypothetical protein
MCPTSEFWNNRHRRWIIWQYPRCFDPTWAKHIYVNNAGVSPQNASIRKATGTSAILNLMTNGLRGTLHGEDGARRRGECPAEYHRRQERHITDVSQPQTKQPSVDASAKAAQVLASSVKALTFIFCRDQWHEGAASMGIRTAFPFIPKFHRYDAAGSARTCL